MNTFVCISSYFKGKEFLQECKALGNRVFLITSKSLDKEDWPWESLDEVFYMEEIQPYKWNMDHLILGFQHLMKANKIDRVIALDDYDVEKAALIRESFRITGMGQTTHRYFRDKLAMRRQAVDCAIHVPAFTAIFNDQEVNDFADTVSAPWVLKPRSEASASGIKKIHNKAELWRAIDSLGQERHLFLLEQFRPGNVFHVDSVVYNKEVVFTSCSQYLNPPMDVAHGGGVFRTITLSQESQDFKDLVELNRKVLTKFGIVYGATHTEFIRCHENDTWYFLETSARVGGAFIPDMVEAATQVNLWREWARLEHALMNQTPYKLPKQDTHTAAALLISLAKEKYPDLSPYHVTELYKTLPKPFHVGLLLQSNDRKKLLQLLEEFAQHITKNIMGVLPATDKPTS